MKPTKHLNRNNNRTKTRKQKQHKSNILIKTTDTQFLKLIKKGINECNNNSKEVNNDALKLK